MPFRNSQGRRPQPQTRSTPLTDNRYQDLLAQARAFFAEAETDRETQRLMVIDEIRSTMQAKGITVEDLA